MMGLIEKVKKMYEEIYIYNNNNVIGIAKIYKFMIQLIDYRIYYDVNLGRMVKD